MLQFKPKYLSKPWGGRRLETELSRTLPNGNIGESWELVELPSHQSEVSTGLRRGDKLGDLWRQGLIGGRAEGAFPFLLKWLDTHQRLSVQVHPNEDFCTEIGFGRAKNEAWYIADATPNAKLYIGNRKGLTPAILQESIQTDSLSDWMHTVSPKPGELYFVPARTLHYISGGVLILEIQDPSDTTFRVYDWNRTDKQGRRRELHLKLALECIAYDRYEAPKPQMQSVTSERFVIHSLDTDSTIPSKGLRILIALQHQTEIQINATRVLPIRGDVLVLEPTDVMVHVKQGTCLLITDPKE